MKVVMRTIKTYLKVGAFYIACEAEWLLKNSLFLKKAEICVIEHV